MCTSTDGDSFWPHVSHRRPAYRSVFPYPEIFHICALWRHVSLSSYCTTTSTVHATPFGEKICIYFFFKIIIISASILSLTLLLYKHDRMMMNKWPYHLTREKVAIVRFWSIWYLKHFFLNVTGYRKQKTERWKEAFGIILDSNPTKSRLTCVSTCLLWQGVHIQNITRHVPPSFSM